jgi:ComF family protein
LDCQKQVNILDGNLCDICGLPQDKPGVCETCLAERPHFRALRAWAVFSDPVQPALHGLKYRKNVSMGDSFAFQMIPFVERLNWQADVLIPIPLGRQRFKERGYNQVGMIAKPLALALGMRYAPKGLVRRKETRSQVGLTKVERKTNVQHAFQAGMGVNGKTVLIMDDVSTTGSTLSAGAQVLYAAGAKDVYALTVARALPQHGLRHA